MMGAYFAAVWESIADAVPDQAAVVQGDRRVSWREYEQRAARLAQAFLDAGLSPGAKVGMYLYNSPEYCETNFAALKIRGVPINVNYRYLDNELHYLLENADVEALVFHTSLGDRVARVRERLPGAASARRGRRWRGGRRLRARRRRGRLRGSAGDAARRRARIEPHGDEVYILYTGGTTGMPKGVMYPLREFTEFFLMSYPPMIGLAPVTDPAELPRQARRGRRVRSPAGRDVRAPADARHGVLARDDDAAHVRRHGRAARGPRPRPDRGLGRRSSAKRVQHLIVVGDAFAKPLLRALDESPGPLGPVVAAADDLVGGDVLGRRQARPDRSHPGAGDRRRARRRPRAAWGRRSRPRTRRRARPPSSPSTRRARCSPTTVARCSRGRARSAWSPTAGWCRSATTRIRRSRPARSAR